MADQISLHAISKYVYVTRYNLIWTTNIFVHFSKNELLDGHSKYSNNQIDRQPTTKWIPTLMYVVLFQCWLVGFIKKFEINNITQSYSNTKSKIEYNLKYILSTPKALRPILVGPIVLHFLSKSFFILPVRSAICFL